MAKRPTAPSNSVSFWTGSALVYFDGHDLTINRPSGSIKGIVSYPVDQISGIQITKPPLSLHVFRILVAGESAPRRSQGMLEVARDPFAVQFNSRCKAEAEAVAQAVRDAQAALRAPDPAAPQPASDGLAGQLQQLAALHAQGALSDAEFAAAKARLIGGAQDETPGGW
jgi:hypothetical protein